ncbi:hypothetical protein [Halococcus sp. PRR34]|nr:hypothetical protein [Halococcus sp. PRR34]
MTENAFAGGVTADGSAHDAITTEQYQLVEQHWTIVAREVGT